MAYGVKTEVPNMGTSWSRSDRTESGPQRRPRARAVFAALSMLLLVGCGNDISSSTDTSAPMTTQPIETNSPATTPLTETSVPLTTLPVETSAPETIPPVYTSTSATTPPTATSAPSATLPVETTTSIDAQQKLCEGDLFCDGSSEDMLDAYNNTIALVQPFFVESYATPPKPSHYFYISNEKSPVGSGCGPLASEDTALFCPADQNVYLGQEQMWSWYRNDGIGDAGLGLILAHELGHLAQENAGVPFPKTNIETIVHENQADCIAGSWARWAFDEGKIDEPAVDEIDNTLRAVASTEGVERSHGTLNERIEAFDRGLFNGIDYCNDYYSQTPIRTPAGN